MDALLPGENETREYIRNHCAEAFSRAHKALELTWRVHRSLAQLESAALNETVRAVVIGLLTKMWKGQYAVCHLCELGLTDEAAAIMRGLLEAVFVLRAIFLSDLDLPSDAPEPRPDTGTKARLILAKIALDEGRYWEFLRQSSSPRAAQAADIAAQNCKVAKQDLSPDWITWCQKHYRHFLGLDTATLAKRVGMENEYNVLYRSMCWSVHPSGLLDLLEPEGPNSGGELRIDCRLHPDCDHVPISLQVGTELLCAGLKETDRHFALGFNEQIKDVLPRPDS